MGLVINLEDYIQTITQPDGAKYSLYESSKAILLKDGTTSTLDNVLSTINSSIETTANFLTFEAQKTAEIIIERITSDAYLDSLIGSILSDIILGENDPKEIAKHLAEGQLKSLASSLLDENIRKALIDSGMSQSQIDNLVGPKVANYVMTTDSAGNQIVTPVDASGKPVGATLQGTVYTAIINFAIAAADSSGWSSEEYAQAAKVAIASAIVSAVVTTVLTAIAPGIGTVAGIVISAVVCALVVGPLVTYADDQYKITEDVFIMARDLTKDLIRDPINTIEDFDPVDTTKQLTEYAKDYVENIGKFGRNVLIGGYNLFGGNYGKTYKPGQYPTPYPSVSVTPKEDGTGNIIQGLDPEGVVAIAREYYHDDLYGNSGSDNLVGKSGTNTIYGFEGNDHIEGRGDVDLLVAGKGDDEVFGGNGDDQIYGSEGNDMLFGGNGDDIIIGGTGASISGSGSLNDGNDFIQSGNGDDQIMGEAGDDTIQGNAGNDTILGGIGNDRIEGNEGDDSILGEDGDDMILGGLGSDIIDGGNGTDYIEGNEGSDNIRGGDGNDEILGQAGIDIIYGDAGNDLINAGSENDLVFGGLGNDIIYGAEGDDTLSGELGNDYIIGAEGNDTIDGGAGDDVILGGVGNDTITTGEGNDTIIYRTGDGQDTITDTDTAGNDILRLTEINSKLSNNTTDKLVLTKSGTDLVVHFKDDSGSIITSDKITVTNQFGGTETNGTGSEILKKIEFADGKSIDLTNITINGDDSISYTTSLYSNIDTSIQEELALGYNDIMQVQDEQTNPNSTYSANNYNSSGEQDEIDSEKYNDVQWRSKKEKRSIFGGYYTVWYKYYEQNLSGTNGNDRVVGSWWNENVYGGNGDDQLHGGDGNDNIYGGEGADILHGGAGNDNVYGQAGEDLIYGGSGNDNLDGGTDNDTIYANEGNDTVIGGAGDDYLEGNGGNDSITDNEGNNIIIAGLGADIINAGSGNDKIEGNDDADNINAGDGNNLIYGNGGNDSLASGSGNDTIYGQEGFDLINAGAGDDYISGGANDDILNGEDGNDTIFGDIGIDQINGGNGNDYIYGGSGADILKGDAGADQIKGGDSDDWIEGGADNDSLYGQSGSDKIYGDTGNDYIDGGIEGDVLDGGDGDDAVIGGQGNDILVDGKGSDTLDGGSDSDIIILTKEVDENGDSISSTSVDTVTNFNKDEDKIILKVSYKTPITFADIQAGMVQNGSNVEIALNNGQKIIIENITTSDITSSNFQIGLSGGANNDILFGTNGENIIFGDAGDDKIYGGDGNDELWGGKGSDELYGEGGDDILRYEADGKYVGDITETMVEFDSYVIKENIHVDSRKLIDAGDHYTYVDDHSKWFSKSLGWYIISDYYSPAIWVTNARNYSNINDDIFFGHSDSEASSYYTITPQWSIGIFGLPYYASSGVLENHFNYAIKHTFIKNFYNNQVTEIDGYNRTFDKFIGGDGVNTILMTEGNDVLTLDDPTSASGANAAGTSTSARVQGISVIHAGAGDDVINFSTQKYSYSDTVVYGGTGNDKIWLSSGNDRLFGDSGNDEIYGGAGNDFINGGDGNDVLVGGLGNDKIEGGIGNDNIAGEAGDDVLEGGAGADVINGGEGSEVNGDTISYLNSSSAVVVNIANNTVSGGDAQGDVISNFENIIGSNYADTLTGDANNNIIEGGAGDDILFGGGGSDTYVYNLGDGNDTIIDGINNHGDFIAFEASVKKQNLIFSRSDSGKDLIIKIKNNLNDSLSIQDQLIGNGSGSRVEGISFKNGVDSAINLQNQSFIGNEDQALIISLDQIEGSRIANVVFDDSKASYDSSTGLITYNSEANFNGVRELTYRIKDSGGNIIKTNTINLLINFVNDLPVANLSNVTVNEDATILIDVLANVSDVDGDEFNIIAISQPTKGIADIIGGKIIYKPDNQYNGTDSLIYTIKDSNGGIITKELTINILAGNDAPIVQNVEDKIIKEDNILIIDVLKNSYDIDDEDSLTITSVSGANNGQILIIDNKLTYIPNANYFGSETIEYAVSDGKTQIVKNFNITIESVNDLPIATLVSQSLDEDSVVIIDVLQFASDADGDALAIAGVSSPAHGIATIENGKITYTPYPNYFGSDSFNYVISDGNGGLISKQINLAINNVDDVPQINIEGIFNSYEDNQIVFDILNNITDLDGDNLAIINVDGAQNGSVVIDNGSIIYTPNANYYGTETIEYTVSDGQSEITKELVINIASVNDSPVAADDQINVSEDSDNVIDILNNDTDIEDETLKRENILLGSALYGTVFLNANNQIIYKSNKNYFGVDQFTYAIKDSNGAISNISTVNLNVANVNDAPTIKNSLNDQMVRADQLEEIDISKIFADADGDNLEIKIKMEDGTTPDWISNTKDIIRINATNNDVGAINLILVASDGEFEISTLFTLVVKESLKVRNDDRINIIESTSGNNTVFANIGKTDLIFAGEGDDDIMYIADNVWGAGYVATNSYTGDSIDVVGKIRSYDAFDGGKGDVDTLYLTEGDDGIFLDDLISDNPTISGSRLFGIEIINALGGNDIIDLSSNIFTYGSVTINGSEGNDYLWSNDGNDTINGAGGNDHIVGGRGNDIMLGGDGNDIIKGYDGNDSLTGGAGADVMIGGVGNDQFIFTDLTHSTTSEMDNILDFVRFDDKINLSGLGFDSVSDGIGSASAHGIEYHFEGGNTIIDDPNSNFAVKLAGEIHLDHNDFAF